MHSTIQALPIYPCTHHSATEICFMGAVGNGDSEIYWVYTWRLKQLGDLRLTELDQILVCGAWVEATDIQIGFAQLFSPTAAAAAIADGGGGGVASGVVVVVGAWWSHLMVGGGHIRLLWKKTKQGTVSFGVLKWYIDQIHLNTLKVLAHLTYIKIHYRLSMKHSTNAGWLDCIQKKT